MPQVAGWAGRCSSGRFPAQRRNGTQPHLGLCTVALGLQQPVFEQAAAHAGLAGVEQRKQGGRLFAAQGLCEFQVAPRDTREADQLVIALHVNGVDVGEGAPLGVFGVSEQTGGGRVRLRQVLRVPGGQAGGLEQFKQFGQPQLGVKLPFGANTQGQRHRRARLQAQALEARFEGGACTRAIHHLAGRNTRHPACQIVKRALRQGQQTLGNRQPGQPAAVAWALVHGQQDGFALVTQQLRVCQRARCDDPHHFAFDGPFAGNFAHLLAYRYRFTELDQARQVGLDGMKGHTGHHHRLAGGLAALGERDVEQARGLLGVGKKQLVKIAHAVQQQGVGVPGFQRQVLLHHRRVGGQGNIGIQGAAILSWRAGV